MVSDEFRYQLRQEARLWQAEGLIDADQYQQLKQRYQFNVLETAARDRFTAILIGTGGILLGLAVLTFVAANWQAGSRESKFALLLGLLIAVNVAGFYLWRRLGKGVRGQQQLGQGFLLFGAIILGANVEFMAQVFHIDGSMSLFWGLGVVVMAYSLRMTSLGVLALLLVGVGYLRGLRELYALGDSSMLQLMVQHLPLLVALVFVPLAYRCRSRWIFGLAAIASIFSLEVNLRIPEFLMNSNSAIAWVPAIAFALPPALLWGYDDLLFPTQTTRRFRFLARALALLFLGILFYGLSFHWFWHSSSGGFVQERSLLDKLPLLDVGILSVLTLVEWLHLAYRGRSRHGQRKVDLTTIVIASLIAIAASVPLWHVSVSPIPAIAPLIFNGLLFLLACGLMREGLEQGERRIFWGGLSLLALQILSRMLEYEEGLLLKSVFFLLCGIGVIVTGLWFERHLSALTPSKEHSS